ncbi:MAG: hypothetical protein WB561_07915 [Terracidiphilus sp.]
MQRVPIAGLAFRCRSAAVLVCAVHLMAAAEPVPAHHLEGTLHGFLALTTEQGEVLANGDLIEMVRGDRVTAHLTFHFKDGSLDDETTVYTQRGVFRLISDRHIQKGPYFPHPLDMTIDVAKGIVVTHSLDKDGKDEVATDRIKMPEDLYNGLVMPVIKNVSPDAGETKISMIVATPKPRLVTLSILPQAPETFYLAGTPRRATEYEIKIQLGGIAGAIAPVIGKQPPNIYVSIETGQVPAFLRESGPLFEGGAVLNISLIGPTWSSASHDQPAK